MLPYASSPGRDVGITGDDYAWLLGQCKANADWQLNFRISFAAPEDRLLRGLDIIKSMMTG
jgi:hypothetical protein